MADVVIFNCEAIMTDVIIFALCFLFSMTITEISLWAVIAILYIFIFIVFLLNNRL